MNQISIIHALRNSPIKNFVPVLFILFVVVHLAILFGKLGQQIGKEILKAIADSLQDRIHVTGTE